MTYLSPARVDSYHRTNQTEAPPISLIAKRCACGTRTTAKQLAQAGKCAACGLAAVVAAIMPGDLKKLQHMLGAVSERPKRQWGLRNYYCANASGAAREAMQRLADAGLATMGHKDDKQAYFHATRLGCRAAGLSGAAIKRAMED